MSKKKMSIYWPNLDAAYFNKWILQIPKVFYPVKSDANEFSLGVLQFASVLHSINKKLNRLMQQDPAVSRLE